MKTEISIQKSILNELVDKYEKSKNFTEDSVAGRKPALQPEKLFPEYADDLAYELFSLVNEAAEDLAQKQFVTLKYHKNTTAVKSIELNLPSLPSIYSFLKRKPKKERNEEIVEILGKYKNSNPILHSFCSKQMEKIEKNQKVEYYENNEEFENVLLAVQEALKVKEETFVRDFSIKLFGDSKEFEKIKSKVEKILFHYGNFPDENTVLREVNIVKNPGYIYFRGNAILTIKGKEYDISILEGGFGLSSLDLKSIEKIEVKSSEIITIENLTSFNYYRNSDAFIIYTGGFCNEARRNFLKILYSGNPDKEYCHWSDIDVGGFLIFNHIKKETGIDFKPLYMDIKCIERYKNYCKPLTDNDKKRLQSLQIEEFSEVAEYMLKTNRKLEQEAFSIF